MGSWRPVKKGIIEGIRPLWTGLRECFDVEGSPIPCQGSGQDPEFSLQRMWPPNRFIVKGDVVLDELTGLSWTRDANLFGFPATWSEAISYIHDMNRNGAFGYRDWRLPNRREMRSLLDLGEKRPSLPKGHPFLNVFNGWYWTSTTFSGFTNYAWWVHLEGARMFYGRKDQYAIFWPVRGEDKGVLLATGQTRCHDAKGKEIDCAGSGQDGEYRLGHWIEEGRFETLDRHVVLDRLTGLLWTKSADLANGPVRWDEALRVVKEMNSSDTTDETPWRLPTINELESLVHCDYSFPALPPWHPFEHIQEVYWSSTTSIYETDWAWALYLGKGATGVGKKDVARFWVWAVR